MPPSHTTRLLRPFLHNTRTTHLVRRAFTTTPALPANLPPRKKLLDSDLIENFLKGSGPGGQKINKTSSAVQLIHKPTGIVVKYQDTRSRTVNRAMARKILQERIEEVELGEDARTKVKARTLAKKKASSGKKSRRKYRALENKEGDDGEEVVEGHGEEGQDARGVGEVGAADGREVGGEGQKPKG
ncbi:peptidyl-tRNA hydrolase domain protein [Paraphoma chrysanthemicola]|uniref:Peptidyl-tRNA hydrolase domain protein n=1 Tax=Paraphoma chrysanthemicola TaxID=798071 RepID=A0A8K0RBY6_9PLEO|nr:peptidyl-tRNA hydrolase domain protein [Paraphoma chrysanthemicola]